MSVRINRRAFQWQSLKTRITLLTLAVFLAGIWSLTFYISQMLRRDMVQLLGGQQFSTASYAATDINNQLQARIDALQAVAGGISPAMLDNPAALQAMLDQRVVLLSMFNSGVVAVALDGAARADAPVVAGRKGTSYASNVATQTTLTTGQSVIGRPVIGRVLRQPLFNINVPIRDAQGKVIGALFGVINLAKPNFLENISQNGYGKTGGYLVIARQDRLIVTATDKSRVMQALPAPGVNGQIDLNMQGFEGYIVYRNSLDVEILNSIKGIPVAGWNLAVNLPTAEAFAPIRAMQQRAAAAALLLSLLAGVLTWWLVRRQLTPMAAAVKLLTSRHDADSPPMPLPITSEDEVGELLGSFNHLLEKLRIRDLALHESEQRFRQFFEKNTSVMVLSDPATGLIVDTNDAAAHYYGYTRANMAGTDINNIIALSPKVLTEKRARAKSGQEKQFQFSVRLASGEMRDVESHVTPLDVGGRRLLFSIIHDITERTRAQAALRLARISVDATSDALFWVAPDARIVDANAAACRLLGYTKLELLQLQVSDINPDPLLSASHWPQYFEELRQSGSKKYEASNRTRDGRLIFVEVVASHVRDGNAEFSCVSIRDITERKRIDAELRAAQVDAVNADHAKSRFLAAASHDLRQPLSALALYVGVLKSRAGSEPDELIQGIQECCDGLSELLMDLLDVSKLDAGIVEPKLSDFAVDDFLASLVAVHTPLAQARALALRWRRCGGFVRTDHQLLTRIARNLVDNAIRYTSQGGVLIACRHHGGKHWLEVWDTGVGIPTDQTGLVFEDFRQLGDGSRNRGSGLGLAIVARAAALLGLEIRLCSRVGRGSMFAIELPLGQPMALVPARSASVETRALRIGVVEDNTQVLRALVVALEAAGHEVVSASTAQELLEGLAQLAPDMVISDYRLGEGETGFDVIETVRAVFGASLAAIVITGDTDPALLRSMAEQDISVHFKPLQLDALLAVIHDATQRSSS